MIELKGIIKQATHIPLLVRAFEISEGDVVEIGTGYFSTAILRWLCEMSGRTLYSYESSNEWYKRAMRSPSPSQKIIKVENWDEADIERHWGLAFIDHAPDERRWVDIKRIANHAEYIVIHDTQPGHDYKHYHYSRIWDLFKYRYDFTKYLPNTSVVSNFHDLKEFE